MEYGAQEWLLRSAIEEDGRQNSTFIILSWC